MNILILEPPSVSEYGNQRIWGGNGSLKSSFFKPPHDLMAISGYLRKEGYNNVLYDSNALRIDIDDLVDALLDVMKFPDVVIFSNSTCTIYQDVTVAKKIKELNPRCLTITVGAHSMSLPVETLEMEINLDIVVVSNHWEEVCFNIVNNKHDFGSVNGICYRSSDGVDIVTTGSYLSQMNYNQLGFPAHDKIIKNIYDDPTAKRLPKTIVQGQKGCIHVCNFCCQPAFFGAPTVNYRTTDHIIEELKWVSSLGFKEVMFNDATLTGDVEWAKDLFNKMIDNDIDLTWNCTTRANRLDVDMVDLMKKAGCHTIMIGLESADKNVLKNIKKSMSPIKVKEAVNIITKAGINSVVFAVVGFQGETENSIRHTINFLTTLNTTFITLGIAVPVPGTEFYSYVKNNGYLLTDDWSRYDPMKKPVFSYPELTADQILWYSRNGLKQFYLRPSYMLRRALEVRSFIDLKHLVVNFLGFVKRYIITK